MDLRDEGELIRRLQQHDEKAFQKCVKLYQTIELAKRMTYDGLDTGPGWFAGGNKLERKNGKDGMRTLISEEREHMQSEAQRKQGNNHGR